MVESLVEGTAMQRRVGLTNEARRSERSWWYDSCSSDLGRSLSTRSAIAPDMLVSTGLH